MTNIIVNKALVIFEGAKGFFLTDNANAAKQTFITGKIEEAFYQKGLLKLKTAKRYTGDEEKIFIFNQAPTASCKGSLIRFLNRFNLGQEFKMRKFILLFALMSFLMTGCATPNETNVNTNTVPLTVQNDDKGVMYYVGLGIGTAFWVAVYVTGAVVSTH